MVPKLVLSTTGFNSYLPQHETRLEVSLTGERGKKAPLAQFLVTLCREPLTLANLAIKVRGATWANQPGRYRIVFSVEGTEVACLPFILVSQEELLHAIKVTDVCINAEDKTGRIMKKPATVTLSVHRAIAPTLDVKIGILAPNVLFAFSVLLMEEERILMRVDLDLQLDDPIKQVKCRPVRLDALPGRGQQAERHLTVAAFVADEKKAEQSFTLICVQTIANFEGQLTVDPDNLEVDDSEYHEILQRLR